MFFLISNLTMEKYYSNFYVQFIVGSVCYAFTYGILSDVISSETYNSYKYYLLFLIIIDTSYFIYKKKYHTEKIEPKIEINTEINTSSSNINTESIKLETENSEMMLNTMSDNSESNASENSIFLSENSS